jgi:uncharacterized membrane protein
MTETSEAANVAKTIECAITQRHLKRKDAVTIEALRPSLAERIRLDHPDLAPDSLISRAEVDRYRRLYVEEILMAEHGEFSELDRQVAESIAKADTIAENVAAEYEERRTFGELMSDALARFGGSWGFILCFAFFMAVWMTYNVAVGDRGAFDPYPFILLNLALSCLAAIQAPIIMMSQRRQETKDRLRSESDYRTNLKAELEIRHLHEKLDHLITKQWQRMAEIQQLQLEMLLENKGGKRQKPITPGQGR